jgi:hypothetical protein
MTEELLTEESEMKNETNAMFALEGEFHADPGAFYVYDDYRLDAPERGPFYHGIGGRSRVKKAVRQFEQSYHRNTVRKHGLLRKFRFVGLGDAGWTAACEIEIAAIAASRAAGFRLANITDGGDGTRGVVTLVNRATGEGRAFPKDEPWPEGWTPSAKGVAALKNPATGLYEQVPVERLVELKAQGWTHATEGAATLKNPATGLYEQVPVERLAELKAQGWTHAIAGNTSLKNPDTGLYEQVPVERLAELKAQGWTTTTEGTATLKNPATGLYEQVPVERLAELKAQGWTHANEGNVALKNPDTGLYEMVPVERFAELKAQGWKHASAGNTSLKNPDTGLYEQVPVERLAELKAQGWKTTTEGTVTLKNPVTGLCEQVPVERLAELKAQGWKTTTEGTVTLKNPVTGLCEQVPVERFAELKAAGWAHANEGNTLSISVEAAANGNKRNATVYARRDVPAKARCVTTGETIGTFCLAQSSGKFVGNVGAGTKARTYLRAQWAAGNRDCVVTDGAGQVWRLAA